MDIATLGIAVDSRQVKQADRDLDNLQRTGTRVERQTDQLGAAFKRLAAPLAAYLSGRQIAQSAEQWNLLNNRLRIVTDTTQELLDAQDAVFGIAQRSRQPLAATAELYQRIATNADSLRLSGAGVAAVVDTINKTLAVSGTSAASANAALIQLGQAFASGVLRGEELNSVLEQAPALSRAIAAGLGVSVGELKALGEEGTLTARNIIDALLSQADAVDQQFARIQATGSQALSTLGNSITKVVGDLDTATGATAAFAGSVIELSQYLDSGQLTDGILESMALWRQTIDLTTESLGGLSNEMGLLGDIGGESAQFIGRAFQEMPVNVRTAVQAATVEIAGLVDRAKNAVDTLGAAFLRISAGDFGGAGDAFAQGEASYQALLQARQDSLQAIFDEREAILSVAEAESTRRQQERNDRAVARAEREKEIAELRANANGVTLAAAMTDAQKKAAKDAERAVKQLLDRYTDTEASLAEQIALYGEVGEAARIRYAIERGELVGIDDAQQQRLETLAEELDALERNKDIQERVAETVEGLRTAEEIALDTAIEKYNALNEAVAAGIPIVGGYEDAVRRVGEEYDKALKKANESTVEMSEFAKQAARNIQDAFADFLFDPFKDGLDGMLENFGRILQRMAAEAAAAQIFDSIGAFGSSNGGLMSGNGSGGWVNALASIASLFSFDGGGFTGPGSRFGGLDGRGGFLAMVHPNETIVDHTKGQSAGSSVQIGQMVFPNVRTEREAREATGAAARQLSRLAQSGQRYS